MPRKSRFDHSCPSKTCQFSANPGGKRCNTSSCANTDPENFCSVPPEPWRRYLGICHKYPRKWAHRQWCRDVWVDYKQRCRPFSWEYREWDTDSEGDIEDEDDDGSETPPRVREARKAREVERLDEVIAELMLAQKESSEDKRDGEGPQGDGKGPQGSSKSGNNGN